MKIVADANIPFVKECFSSIGQVVTAKGREINAELLTDADILLVRSVTKVGAGILDGSSVKFVATATIGIDHIDIDYLNEKGIAFASAPGSNANSVGEYIVAALLAVAKKNKITLEGRSIGIVGVGNVGSKVALKAEALGMKVLLNDPPLQRQTNDPKYVGLQDIFGCDFITMHTPLTVEGQDKTYHIADEEFFANMKADAFFMNSSRGAVHDTEALKTAIAGKKIAGAILDVWEDEPAIDNDLLLKAELSTPHIAGYSYDGKVAGMIMIYNAACECFGLQAKYLAADFLPDSDVPQIAIDPAGRDEQAIIQDTVQQVYVINRDDFNTREILIVPPDERSQWFDDLRKDYPVRREFQNTRITAIDEDSALARKLKGIGFTI
jgi:erythronate-4-phosphate dehydrogenase